MAGGLLVAVAAQFVYAWSLWAGQALGDRGCDRDIALLLATVSFWVMDCANNVLQLPARVRAREQAPSRCGPCCRGHTLRTQALVADLASEEQQELGQALVSLWSAVGSVAAFAAAALVDPVGRIRGYFGLASALLVCSCTATIVVALRAQKGAPERGRGSSSPGEDSERASLLGHGSVNAQAERRTGLAEDGTRCGCHLAPSVVSDALLPTLAAGDPFLVSVLEPLWTVLNLPHSMRALCAVQFLAWAAWFCYMPVSASVTVRSALRDFHAPCASCYRTGARGWARTYSTVRVLACPLPLSTHSCGTTSFLPTGLCRPPP